MPKSVTTINMSSSISIVGRGDSHITTHFRWRSIKNFLYLAFTSASTPYNVDIFSKVWQNVRIFEFILFEAIVGIPYMFMDCFIKQYTRRLDCNKHLNPLLRGITFGLFLQTALWTLINAAFLADSLRFLVLNLKDTVLLWASSSKCIKTNSTCTQTQDLVINCKQDNISAKFSTTCALHNYEKTFTGKYSDRSIMTARFFVMVIIWIGNFFFSSVTEDALLKFLKLVFIVRSCSSIVILIFLLILAQDEAYIAATQMLDVSWPHSYTLSMDHICFTYGIGFLGLYDFGTMSPYIMVDNAVIIFMCLFTLMAFINSWIVKIFYIVLIKCVIMEPTKSPHLIFFGVLPLATEFFSAHKFYVLVFYMNMALTAVASITMLTLTMAKFLQNEFRSIRQIYIIGILCFMGFSLSLVVSVTITGSRVYGITLGLNIALLYLGGSKAMFAMWVYGVQRFSTDIHFWLGFKPTKFWSITWMLLPVILFGFMIYRVFNNIVNTTSEEARLNDSLGWIALTLVVVYFFQIKTIVWYLVSNNLAGLFKASLKYGSIDPDDRKKRKVFNEILRLRRCQHNCMPLDEIMECYHQPSERSKLGSPISSLDSLRNIFEAGTSHKLTDASVLHMAR